MRWYSVSTAIIAALVAAEAFWAADVLAAEPVPWEKLHPKLNGYDWVQLTSGEWLKGEIEYMQNDKLAFDSSKLGLLIIDFKNIEQIYGRARMSVALAGGGRVVGMIKMHGGSVYVSSGKTTQMVEREQILGVVSEKLSERDRWEGRFSLGFDMQQGNTQQSNVTTTFNLKRRTADSRFLFDYLGTTTFTSEGKTSDSHRINSSYDIFVTRHFYLQPLFIEYFSDVFQNIRHRATVGTGVGYELIDAPEISWSIFTGLGMQYLEFVNVEPGSALSHTSMVGRVGTRFDYDVTGDVKFSWDYTMNLLGEANGLYTHHMVAMIRTQLISDFTVDLSGIWDRVQNPATRADGTVPYRDDYRTVLSVGYKF